jgi:WD40 repeat protein
MVRRLVSRRLLSPLVSPDGSRLLIPGSEHSDEAFLYDTSTLEQMRALSPVFWFGFWEGPPARFSPDGSKIVAPSGKIESGHWNHTFARMWNTESGKELAVLGPPENFHHLTFVGKGDRVMTSGGSFIRLWDAAKGTELVQIRVREGNNGMVQASASPDGLLVASGSEWIRAAVWDLDTGNLVTELKGAREKSFVQRFTPDGRYVVTTDDIGTVAFWYPTTGELARALHGSPAMIHSIDMSASGDRLLAGGYDYTVRMWDTLTNRLLFFADLLPHRTSGFPMLPGYGRVHALLRPSVQQALVKLVIPGSEPGLLFDLPYNTFDQVVNAAYTTVPYRFTEDERAELELDLFGRPDPRSADLEELTVKVPF